MSALGEIYGRIMPSSCACAQQENHMKDFFNALKSDLLTVLQTRLGWLLAGIFGSGTDVPSVVNNVKGFFGF